MMMAMIMLMLLMMMMHGDADGDEKFKPSSSAFEPQKSGTHAAIPRIASD